eukprot:scaffold5380_cov131-Cylindrotheca_fusiformis.AAC.3
MRRTSNRQDTNDKPTITTGNIGWLFLNAPLIGYIAGFCFFRAGEAYYLLWDYPVETTTSLVATLFLLKWSKLPWQIISIMAMAAFLFVTDFYLLDPIPIGDAFPQPQKLIVVTGANSGVGFETSKQLAEGSSNITVVMGCRSMRKCDEARKQIESRNVVPLQLDLNDFDSVHKFTESLEHELPGRSVDVLFNNAGYNPPNVEKINQYGLDPSFTAMHLSHHLLTELLIQGNNRNLRVVTTSSGTHNFCAVTRLLPESIYRTFFYAPGCIDEEYLKSGIHSSVFRYKYITSKVANVMHVVEIPRRHPSTTAIAVELGFVGTAILPHMTGELLSFTSLGWMRSARIGVHPVMQAILQPLEYFDDGTRDWSKKGGLLMNSLGSIYEPWRGTSHKERMEDAGRRLWEKSTSILKHNAGCRACIL